MNNIKTIFDVLTIMSLLGIVGLLFFYHSMVEKIQKKQGEEISVHALGSLQEALSELRNYPIRGETIKFDVSPYWTEELPVVISKFKFEVVSTESNGARIAIQVNAVPIEQTEAASQTLTQVMKKVNICKAKLEPNKQRFLMNHEQQLAVA